MRRGLRKTKQVIAGILSAALLMTSLPQNSTYVYATEQAEELTTDETTQTQNEEEKITDVQTDSTTNKETQLQAEAETNKTDNSENAITEVETTKTQDNEKMETEEQTTKIQDGEKTKKEEETTKMQDEDKTETEESQDKSKSEEANETQTSTKENTESDTETQEESLEQEETTDSEESEIESETKELETEYENKTDLQEKIVKEELEGVYQFGDYPTDNDGSSAYSVNLAADTNISELEEYLYQQMKERNETIDVESYQISIDKMGGIVSGILNDKADLYFVNKRYSYGYIQSGDTNIVTNVNLTYSNSYNDNAFQNATKEALAVVKSGMSDLEKAIVLHDYLAVNCEYDYENYLANKIPDESYTAYGVLVNRTAVCQGYALAYKYLLNKAGINCYMVSSKTMNHAWNLIVLNGKYYQVDVTWDDPTWDLIGRVRHEYMFRSDNAFINECEHKDWSITDGSEVVDYKAVDTTYDTAFWLNCDSPLVLVGEDCYYITYDKEKKAGVINKTKLSNITVIGDSICDIGKWTVWGESGWWQNAYSGLFWANNRLYFNDKTTIYSIDLNNIESGISKNTEFTADTTDGYIYGSAFCQGKVLYSLHQNPNLTAKETVLEADITIETDPSEILVEKIELNKETLKLTVGSTAKLQATVTPDNATDANVTWKSSDDAIATVKDGTVTAIAVGSCTITAIAGGKEAVCDVTVSASGEDIASGSYKDITWVIDANGKLTVEGTGEFSDSWQEYRYGAAPWHDNRKSITSAEINVTGMVNASFMFYACNNLTSVDMSGFDTGNVTDMGGMFYNCSSLTSIDVSGFETGNVTNMNTMFYNCSSLTSIDVSGFETGNVTDMGGMFYGCSSLTSIDVSGFETGNVTYMNSMFYNCSSLTSIDVSGFETGNVTNMRGGMFDGCNALMTIHTPCNLTLSVSLPKKSGEAWYAPDGTEITELPQNLNYSIKITKNKIPIVSDPYITVQKIKKAYECGDILNTDDLTVTYYNSDGIAETVTDYTTNANEIDMSVPGTKILTVTYNGLTAEVELTVTSSPTTDPDKENYKVTFDLQGHGTALEEYSTYTVIPKGTTITRPTSPEAEGYQFTGWYKDPDCKTLWDFEKDTIEEDTTLYAGWEITETDPTPDQQNYIVTFNLQGHGTALEEYSTYTAIPKGTIITRPTSPEAEGYQFTGWYKDPDCKTLWDFEKDTIEEDTTLYAGWKSNSGSDDDNPPEDIPDGIWIAQIKDYTYTGKPIIPSVVVYFNKKRLTAGQDYTITYKNNTKAALASAAKAPTVVVKGKGNYAGTKKAFFTINKIQLTEESNLKAAKVYPIGVKYTPIVTANGNVLKSGTDYKLAYCDAYGNELKKQPTKAGNYQLHITGKGNCEGKIIFSYAVSESGGANAINKGTATIANYIYGSEEPKVTLSVDGKTLARDADYLVSFVNTHKKGTATATFIGIGNYTGIIKKNFKVQAAAIQSNNITVAKTASYEKGGAKAEVSVTVNGTELVLGTDYTATYKKNTKLGTASVVIKGKGNYTGSQTKEFKVEPKSLTTDGVKIYVSDVLTGKKTAITLYDTNGKKLAANSDYKAEIDKAAHKVTISAGKNGLYKTETPITISYQELEKGKQVTSVALNKKSNTLPKYFEYTGKEVVLEKDWLTVKAGKNILKSNEFEILGYVNNTKKGTATVIIKGCNGYGGIKMLNFKIKARGLF